MSESVRGLLDMLVIGAFVSSMYLSTHWLNSRVGGWGRLARLYPRRLLWPERRAMAGRIVMGRRFHASYRANDVRVVVGPEGVGLEQAKLLGRPYHPPLLLPWGAIASCSTRTLRFARPEAILTLAEPSLTVRVRGEAAEALQQGWERYGSASGVPTGTAARAELDAIRIEEDSPGA